MKTNLFLAAALASATLVFPGHSLVAEESLPAATKRIFDDHKDSVVWVSAVVKINFVSGDTNTPVNIPEQERKMQALATLIGAKGLAVAALSAIDPSKELSGREFRTPNGPVKVNVSATLKEVKLILPDGTQVPSDVVMKDADVDLVFIMPQAYSLEAMVATFKPIDLKNSTTGAVADDVVTVVRMDEMLDRQPGVQGGQIMAITHKSRTFLRVSGAFPGCPTFAMNGKLLGISAQLSTKDRMPITVLLPTSDVLGVVEQARTAKPLSTAAPATMSGTTEQTNTTDKAVEPK
jgi:hypothetical protein